jgi:hypothetical protein
MIYLSREARSSLCALGMVLCVSTAGAAALPNPVVFTQLPASARPPKAGIPGGLYGEGGRLMRLDPDGTTRVLSDDFQSAADPEISFDGTKILFAGKKSASDPWQIFEVNADGSGMRQVTHLDFDCREPVYQSVLFNLDNNDPWHQIAFVGFLRTTLNETGNGPQTSIFTAKMDGSGLKRVTFNPSNDIEPTILTDGRMIYTGWQRHDGGAGRIQLFGVNLDGTDYALFSDETGTTKRMACSNDRRQVIFVESALGSADGAGRLAVLSIDRPLHTRRALTTPADGLFYSPAPMPGGELLVARRTSAAGSYGIWKIDPDTKQQSQIHATANFHEIQPKMLAARAEPDGRGSVVDEKDPYGILYCLSVHTPAPSGAKRLRIVEGVPRRAMGVPSEFSGPIPARLLGEFDLDQDGSFKAQIPANIPVRVQTIDTHGNPIKTCAWIWVRNKENRGCIGCHEDGELSPANRAATAIEKPPVKLTLPEERRQPVVITRQGARP